MSKSVLTAVHILISIAFLGQPPLQNLERNYKCSLITGVKREEEGVM